MSNKRSESSSDEEVDEVVEDWLDTDSIVLEEVSPRNLRMAISKSSSSGGGSSFYISRCNSSSSSSSSGSSSSGSSSSGSSSSDGSVNSSGGSSLEQLDVEDWLCEDDDVIGADENGVTGGQHYIDEIELTVDSENLELAEQKEFLSQLCAIADLQFDTLQPKIQLKLMRSMNIMDVHAGDVLIREGDEDGSFYFILGPKEAQVEVLRDIDGKEEFLTRINAGQYFGEKFFITNRHAPRNATIRAVGDCTLGCVDADQFSQWTHFRTFLLMKEVPLIRTLPQNFQIEMYSLLKHEVFEDGDYIVRQGDVGDKFYIITDGAADVVQENYDSDTIERKTLVRLYEGHFFGEMALVFDEPRVASVFAVGKTSCLYLSKGAFTKALSAEQFQIMMQDVAYQRAEVREKREKKEQAELAAKATLSRITSTSTDSSSIALSMSSIASIAPLFSRNSTGSTTPRFTTSSPWDSDGGSDNERSVTTTNKLVKRKLSTGQKFINKYIILRELGRGAFGYVYLCKNEEDNQMYAMKTISKSTRKWNMKLTDDIKTEIAVMKSLRHQNVVSLLEVIDDPNAKQIYLVQEYMDGGPLLGDEWNAEPIPEKKVWNYFRDMLRGVSYMHSQGIVHRDIKPQNMLKSADDVVKLADFGTAVLTGGDDGSVVLAAGGTPAFMAPELFQVASKDTTETHARVVSPQVDVWGLGATLYNLVIGHPPWMAKNQIQLAEMVKNIELRFPFEAERTMDPHMKHLIKRMLTKDPKLRITMAEICDHDWVTREGSEPLDEDYLYNLLNPANLASLGGVSKAIYQMNASFSAASLSNSTLNTSYCSSNAESTDSKNSSIADMKPHTPKSSGSNDLLKRSFKLDRPVKPESILSDTETELPYPSIAPRMQRLPSTKRQQFVVKKTDIKTDSGHIVPGLLLTNKFHGSTALEPSTLSNWNRSTNNKSSMDLSLSSVGGTSDSDEDNSVHKSPVRRVSSASACLPRRPNSLNQLRSPEPAALSSSNQGIGGQFVLPRDRSDSDSSDGHMPSALTNRFRKYSPKGKDITRSISLDAVGGILSSSDDDDIYKQLASKSNKSGSKALSKKKKVKQEEDSSDDEVVSLDGDDLDGMLDMLCEVTPSSQSLSVLQNKETGDLTVEKRSNKPLFQVKTWAGQTNLDLGIRYGMAEMRNGRPCMEDRITACASFAELEKKKNVLLTLSMADGNSDEDDVPPPPMLGGEHSKKSVDAAMNSGGDFSFFAVYDGHDGEYVSDYLQKNLHFRFNEKLLMNGGLPIVPPEIMLMGTPPPCDVDENDDCTVRISLLEACCAVEREILTQDSTRQQSALDSRVKHLEEVDYDSTDVFCENGRSRSRSRSNSDSSTSPRSRHKKDKNKSKKKNDAKHSKDSTSTRKIIKSTSSVFRDSASQNFAGSTAVVAVLYTGVRSASRNTSPRKNSSVRSLIGHGSSESFSSFDSISDAPDTILSPRLKASKFPGSFLRTIQEPGESRDDRDSATSKCSGPKSNDSFSSLQDVTNSSSGDADDDDYGHVSHSTMATTDSLHNILQKGAPVKLLIAHVGDCRAVLSEAGVAVQLTVDHHPDVPSEIARVAAAGGWISKNRVNGVLGVTRSFGDIMFKTFEPEIPCPDFYGDEEEIESGIWSKRNQVIAMPEILELDVIPSYEFVVLASDGLFEVFTCSQLVSFVRDELFKHGDAQRAARAAISAVEKQGGQDNTSVVVICLNQVRRDRHSSSGRSSLDVRDKSASRHCSRSNSVDSYVSDL